MCGCVQGEGGGGGEELHIDKKSIQTVFDMSFTLIL